MLGDCAVHCTALGVTLQSNCSGPSREHSLSFGLSYAHAPSLAGPPSHPRPFPSSRAGDHVAVFAENSPSVVEAAAKALGLPLAHCFRLSLPPQDPHCLSEPFRGPATLRGALARYADLLSAPSKAALQVRPPAHAIRLWPVLCPPRGELDLRQAGPSNHPLLPPSPRLWRVSGWQM